MTGVALLVKQQLLQNGYDIPLICGLPVGLRYLETLVPTRLSHSRLTYMRSPDKANTLLYHI